MTPPQVRLFDEGEDQLAESQGAEGRAHEVEVQQTGTWNSIRGVGNLDLQDKYSTGIRTLLGVHSRGFPNLFIMGGES